MRPALFGALGASLGAPEFVGSWQTTTHGTSSTLTLSIPAGLSSGDALIAMALSNNSHPANGPGFPNDWTTIGNNFRGGELSDGAGWTIAWKPYAGEASIMVDNLDNGHQHWGATFGYRNCADIRFLDGMESTGAVQDDAYADAEYMRMAEVLFEYDNTSSDQVGVSDGAGFTRRHSAFSTGGGGGSGAMHRIVWNDRLVTNGVEYTSGAQNKSGGRNIVLLFGLYAPGYPPS